MASHPPSTRPAGKEVPHGTRLYSIAATRYGDSFDGMTVSLAWLASGFGRRPGFVSRFLLCCGCACAPPAPLSRVPIP